MSRFIQERYTITTCVNKALADFAGRGWLKLDGRAVLITDIERLEKRGK